MHLHAVCIAKLFVLFKVICSILLVILCLACHCIIAIIIIIVQQKHFVSKIKLLYSNDFFQLIVAMPQVKRTKMADASASNVRVAIEFQYESLMEDKVQ